MVCLKLVLCPPLLPSVASCRQDVEIEMDRFENTRDATLAKYRMMRPKGKLSDGLNLAVDGIATLCMGELAQAAVCVKPLLSHAVPCTLVEGSEP